MGQPILQNDKLAERTLRKAFLFETASFCVHLLLCIFTLLCVTLHCAIEQERFIGNIEVNFADFCVKTLLYE